MAEKIKIAELSIDDKALIKSTSEIKKRLDELRESQRELKKSGNESSEVFVEQAAEVKLLSKEYNANLRVLGDRTKALADQQAREELLNVALKTEVNTIAAAREQNKLLNQLRNTAVTSLGEQSEEVQKLNAKLDENNEFIKANADAYLAQKINIGNYKESIKEAFDELNIFNGGLGGFIARSKEAGGVGNLVTGAFKSMTQGLIGMTKAALAFIATPIGAVLAAIVAAFALVRNALNRNEESVNKLKKAFAPFIGIVNGVLKALEPLGEFIIDTLVEAFKFMETALYSALDALSVALDFLGFEETAASLKNFNDGLIESARNSKLLADAQAELEREQRKANKVMLDAQREAEKLRQIRDDESLSIRERIAANEELGAVLQKQLEEELRIANIALEVANLRLEAEGRTSELLDAQAEAQERVANIQERITGQESEQLVNRVALQREAAEKQKEIADRAIAEQEAALELFIQQQGIRARTLQESLDIAKEVYRREVEILDAELKNRNITQTEYDAELLRLKNELARKNIEVVNDTAQRELDNYIKANQSKIDSDKFFSEETLRIEEERLNDIAQKRRDFAEKQLIDGVISQQEYNDAIDRINEENRLSIEERRKQREEAKKEKELIDLENKRIAEEERAENQFALEAERLERQRVLEVEAAEKSGADVKLINDKYAAYRKTLENDVAEAKIQANQQSFDAIVGLLGQESNLGKLAAIAAIINNTITESTKAFQLAAVLAANPLTAPLAVNAKIQGGVIIATGAANVAKTVNPKFKEGGISEIQGKSHAQGGVPIYAGDQYIGEAEGGEGIGILNRAAYSGFMDFNNSFISGQSTVGRFTGGGIITQAVKPSSQQLNPADLVNALGSLKLAVAVEDINDGQSNFAEVENGANL